MASTGNWVKVEAQNRNSSQLRQNIDEFQAAFARLQVVVDKMSQMSDGGTEYAGLEAEYGLQAGEGSVVEGLCSSTLTELDTAPFFQQFISRLA